MKPYLSICLTAYNQSELVRNWLEKTLLYKGDDIEVIVSDDCSTEDIKGIAESFKDPRVVYVRNEKNLGHDLNILSGFRHAKADFVFLFRSRDYIVPENIGKVIETIKKHPDAAFIGGTALFPDGGVRQSRGDKLFRKGGDAMGEAFGLYFHPSGVILNVKLLDIGAMEQFFIENVKTNKMFLSHDLARFELAQKGDFITIAAPIWYYAVTSDAKDIAVNSQSLDKKSKSSTDPELMLEKLHVALKWIYANISEDLLCQTVGGIFNIYLKIATWHHLKNMKNNDFVKHYNVQRKKVNIKKAREEFLNSTERIITQHRINAEELLKAVRKYADENASSSLKKYTIIYFRTFIHNFLGDRKIKQTLRKMLHRKHKEEN